LSNDLIYREQYHLGREACRSGATKSQNPHRTTTQPERLKFVAWRRGWCDECYKQIMDKKK